MNRNQRAWLVVEVVSVLVVLLAARELTTGIPYRNAIFMAVTLAIIAYFTFRSDEGLRGIGLAAPESWKHFFLWTGIALTGTVVIGLVLYPLLASWFPAPESTIAKAGAVEENTLIKLVAVGWFAAAFGEEVTFRGFILPRLARLMGDAPKAWILAIIVQACIFAALHASMLGIVVAALFGVLYGWVFWRSGRLLWPVVIAHALPDTISILSGG